MSYSSYRLSLRRSTFYPLSCTRRVVAAGYEPAQTDWLYDRSALPLHVLELIFSTDLNALSIFKKLLLNYFYLSFFYDQDYIRLLGLILLYILLSQAASRLFSICKTSAWFQSSIHLIHSQKEARMGFGRKWNL